MSLSKYLILASPSEWACHTHVRLSSIIVRGNNITNTFLKLIFLKDLVTFSNI